MESFLRYLNKVNLVGRISEPAKEKRLPSGDVLVEFRLIIERDDREGVDTLDIATWPAQLKKRALKLEEDQWVGINGVLRRRFWKTPSGVASRWQVEAREITRL
jgi:single-stranded DNA-binding protein